MGAAYNGGMSDERTKRLEQLLEILKVTAPRISWFLSELLAAEARERETADALNDLLHDRGLDRLIEAAYRRGVRDGAEARLELLRAGGRWEALPDGVVVVTRPGGARP